MNYSMHSIIKTDSGKILLAFMLGWIAAQLIKVILTSIRQRSLKAGLKMLLKSGGMPSGHTASMVAALIMTARLSGSDSSIFAVMVAFTMIVIYDAVNVRWAVGEYGKAINKMTISKEKSSPVKVVEGHTVLEVTAGAVIGIVIGLLLLA